MTFGTHGTFYLRDGWINKIFENVSKDSSIFSDDHAAVHLGIGHNMVTSMRFWGEATGIIEYIRDGASYIAKFTDFGKLLQKKDPYLEKLESIWLLHYNMTTTKDKTSTWYWLFNEYDNNFLNLDKFVDFISPWIEGNYEDTGNRKPKIASSTLKKDIRCLVQTYTKSSNEINPENNLTCPISELDLIIEDGNQLVFQNLSANTIPITIFEYVLYRYLENKIDEIGAEGQIQVNIKDLLQDNMSPGRILRCSTNTLYELLTTTIQRENLGTIKLERTAGLDILSAKIETGITKDLLLNIYEG